MFSSRFTGNHLYNKLQVTLKVVIISQKQKELDKHKVPELSTSGSLRPNSQRQSTLVLPRTTFPCERKCKIWKICLTYVLHCLQG